MNAADLQTRLAHAQRLIAQGDLKAASALLEAALQAAPGEPNTLHMLAAVKQRSGDHAGALALFDEAVRRAPAAARSQATAPSTAATTSGEGSSIDMR